MASSEDKAARIDPHYSPAADGEHPVTELTSDRQGALSPFGNLTFPLPTVAYTHPETEINWTAE